MKQSSGSIHLWLILTKCFSSWIVLQSQLMSSASLALLWVVKHKLGLTPKWQSHTSIALHARSKIFCGILWRPKSLSHCLGAGHTAVVQTIPNSEYSLPGVVAYYSNCAICCASCLSCGCWDGASSDLGGHCQAGVLRIPAERCNAEVSAVCSLCSASLVKRE